jgi:hypothetical protein
MSKVISWCFYVDCKNLERLPEYLVGLKCNQRAARLWFPDWKLKMYIDPKTKTDYPSVYQYVNEIAQYGEPPIELIDCRPDSHPLIERYRPFFDSDVSVCIARDVDSILSKTDADIVNVWINEKDFDVLQYLEHWMSSRSIMGGGVGFKRNAVVAESIQKHYYSKEDRSRGFDEDIIAAILLECVPKSRWKSYTTRMTNLGIYYLKKMDNTLPIDSTILWPVPFFDTSSGYAYEYPGLKWLETEKDVGKITDYAKTVTIRREHTGSHWEQHHKTISDKQVWRR